MFAIDLEGPFLLFSLLREMGIELRMELQNSLQKVHVVCMLPVL
jgi:hypothetical protein